MQSHIILNEKKTLTFVGKCKLVKLANDKYLIKNDDLNPDIDCLLSCPFCGRFFDLYLLIQCAKLEIENSVQP